MRAARGISLYFIDNLWISLHKLYNECIQSTHKRTQERTHAQKYKQARTLTRKHNVISLNMLLRDVNSKQPWDV